MYYSVSIKATIVDVDELDRLRKLKNLSRSQYIRTAIEHYNEQPTLPMFTKGNDLNKGEPVRSIPLMFDQEHADIINKYQVEYNATKVQIIRQALIQEAARDGETFKVITPPPINPRWERVWVKATDIYSLLGMHRNDLYRMIKTSRLEVHNGIKTTHHPEKWLRLPDIIRIYRVDEAMSETLALKGICLL